MPDLPGLSVPDVRNWTNDRYYERGEGYFREDRIRRPRREGRTLKALCHGSRPSPYRVEVTLDGEGIAAGSCSCPVGDGGRCKHAVALLLTWVEQPDAFEAVDPLPDRLRERSKEELIAFIQRLLDFERFDEAADAAAHLPAHKLESLLDRFVERGAPETARAVVEARLDAGEGAPSLRLWLYEHALSTGSYEDALKVARQRFRNRPSTETYEQVRRAAEPLGQWDTVRAELLKHLRDDRRPTLLVQIHLHEDDPASALDLVEPFAGEDRTWAFGGSFLSSVADAVAAPHPEAAIALYEEAARRLVDQRGRSNYTDAASLLQRAEALYEEMDERDVWQAVLDTLYEEELHRLPAAQDEFEQAGLL